MDSEHTYPIKVVARRTGLTAYAIRAWEKRYGAVEPIRTPTNRRVYTEEHLERLLLLARLTTSGYSIGQVAKLPTNKLMEMVKEGEMEMPTPSRPAPEDSHSPEAHLDACVEAVEQMDGQALETTLNGAAVALTGPVLIDEVILPLMRLVGDRWHTGTLRIAQEHLASAAVISFLGSRIRAFSPPPSAPLLLVSTPTGQRHEIGAQAAALAALFDGWRVSYLGPDLPVAEMASAAMMSNARAVALSFVYPADDPRVAEEISELASLLSPGVAVLAGGVAAKAYDDALTRIGAFIVKDLAELRLRLSTLRSTPSSPDSEARRQ